MLNTLQCDEAKPSCSRCARLRLVCIGAGQQRYRFKGKTVSEFQCRNGAEATSNHGVVPAVVMHPPNNAVDILMSSFVETITPSTDFRCVWV